MTDSERYIEVCQLSVAYYDRTTPTGTVLAIDKLDLKVRKGAFISVVGANGCGKTTLLYCLAGLLKPTAGTVTVAGTPPEATTCGYVFQNYRESLYPWLTVQDNISLPLQLAGVPKEDARRRSVELAERLGLSLPMSRYPYTLSGGQQQLAALLRAVIHEPAVLLLDEPFASLDVAAYIDLTNALQRIWQATGATTVFVTHDLEGATTLADTVVALTPRPARVAEIVDVTLPRPRKPMDFDKAVVDRLQTQIINGRAQ